MFKKAVKEKLKAKIMIDGPSGSGKTYGALRLATGLGGKIALLDTENRSASLYADKFDFDVCDIQPPFPPEKYIGIIKDAEQSHDILIIDSISHEWSGEGGCLDIKDKIGPTFRDWMKVTPRHNQFINSIINSKIHVISTVRTKTGYEMGENNGKKTVTKVGLQPITRDGFEYENTVVFTINENNFACSKKDRTSMFTGKDFQLTEDIGKQLSDWLDSGIEPEKPSPVLKTVKTTLNKIKTHEVFTTTTAGFEIKYGPDIWGQKTGDKEQTWKDLFRTCSDRLERNATMQMDFDNMAANIRTLEQFKILEAEVEKHDVLKTAANGDVLAKHRAKFETKETK